MALSANRDVEIKEGDLRSMPVEAGVKIYKGALLMINAAGYLALATSDAAAVFAGVAYEDCDNSAGAQGAVNCLVMRSARSHRLPGSGFTQADLGKKVYADDDETVNTTQTTAEVEVGVIDEVISASEVRVTLTADSQAKA